MECGPPTTSLRMILRKPAIFASPEKHKCQCPTGAPAIGRSARSYVLPRTVVPRGDCILRSSPNSWKGER